MASQKVSSGNTGKINPEFPMKVTGKAMALALVPFLAGLYLIYLGVSFHKQFHPLDSSRWMFILPPAVAGAILIGMIFYVPRRMVKGKLRIKQSGVEYDPCKDTELSIHFPWKDLVYSAPANPQQMVRSLLLVYRDRQVLVYDLFMPRFDQLVDMVRTGHKVKSGMDGPAVQLESGRVK